MVVETQIKQLRQEFRKEMQDLRKLIVGKVVPGQWVKQDIAMIMLNVKYRRLVDIRIHLDKEGKQVGCIKWRKGAGRTVEYYKADLEKYLSKITIG